MRLVHEEIYRGCGIKIYMTVYNYFAKTKLPDETKYDYIGDYEHDFKLKAIAAAKEDIDDYWEDENDKRI